MIRGLCRYAVNPTKTNKFPSDTAFSPSAPHYLCTVTGERVLCQNGQYCYVTVTYGRVCVWRGKPWFTAVKPFDRSPCGPPPPGTDYPNHNYYLNQNYHCYKLPLPKSVPVSVPLSPLVTPTQGLPQDKIIAGCSVFIAGHMTISGLIFRIFLYILTTF